MCLYVFVRCIIYSFYINLHLFFTTIAFTSRGGIGKVVYLCVGTREKVYSYDIRYSREEGWFICYLKQGRNFIFNAIQWRMIHDFWILVVVKEVSFWTLVTKKKVLFWIFVTRKKLYFILLLHSCVLCTRFWGLGGRWLYDAGATIGYWLLWLLWLFLVGWLFLVIFSCRYGYGLRSAAHS